MTPSTSMTILAIAVGAFAFTGGYFDGEDENRKARANIKINHWWEWGVRVVMLGVSLGACHLVLRWFGMPDAKLWGVAGIAMFIFIPAHRYNVNKGRVSWWWMGNRLESRKPTESKIDGFWHGMAWFFSGGNRVDLSHIVSTADDDQMDGKPDYDERLPAKLAYGLDALGLLASIIIYALL